MTRFTIQADALLRKNLTFQKRNVWSNVRIICLPVLILTLFGVVQYMGGKDQKPDPSNAIIKPSEGLYPLLQIPNPDYRAVKSDSSPFQDLPDASCRTTHSCPATILITGNNRTLAQNVAQNFFGNVSLNRNAFLNTTSYSDYVFGTYKELENDMLNDRAFFSDELVPSLSYVQPRCPVNSTFSSHGLSVGCVQGLPLWRKSSLEINDELFKSYHNGNKEGNINEIMNAYDFLDSSTKKFNVKLWYNATYRGTDHSKPHMLRISRAENMISNAYLQSLLGPTAKIILDKIGEMPQYNIPTRTDIQIITSFSPIMFTWIILQLFPVICTSLVYEKQEKLRIMMKMHGLGDAAYWANSYLYFFMMSFLYVCFFLLAGRLAGLLMFNFNALSVQFAFFFVYVNLQISFAFLFASLFSDVKTVSVVSYIMVFATGPLAAILISGLAYEPTFPEMWLIIIELVPGFALYRGIDEMVSIAGIAYETGSYGLLWESLSSSDSAIREVIIVMAIEWFVFIILIFYLDQSISSGKGVKGGVLSFLRKFYKKSSTLGEALEHDRFIDTEKDDVALERKKVEQLLKNPQENYSTICNNLKKVYPGKDGNPDKFAVKGLSLALPKGECFGMLGPNGAGKTSFISMMIGLTKPSSGTAYVEGLDLRTQMNEIYTSLGVCPQHDLLWDTLTGREHLLFYGRLKNLQGAALTQAVEKSLKSVNLFDGGVADKAAGKYSGGMKRRLSVAISLIGDPKIVYLDEPSTGLDPASRSLLWKVVTEAKKDRVIVLTTHSMEEAEHLCDRIGIFVSGGFQCLGTSDELKARYGETYVFTITTSPENEMEVEDLVMNLSSNAKKTYHISGTQKYELPKNEVKISKVFKAVKLAKERFNVQAWGLADTTLEDVFIKVAPQA